MTRSNFALAVAGVKLEVDAAAAGVAACAAAGAGAAALSVLAGGSGGCAGVTVAMIDNTLLCSHTAVLFFSIASVIDRWTSRWPWPRGSNAIVSLDPHMLIY